MATFLEAALSRVVASIDVNAQAPHGLGKERLEAREAVPRVIWTRQEQPSRIVSPQEYPLKTGELAIGAELVPVAIHVVAKTEEEVEQLIDIELLALHAVFGKAVYSAQVNPDKSNETLKNYGNYAQLRVSIPRAVLRVPYDKFKITGYDLDPNTDLGAGWITIRV